MEEGFVGLGEAAILLGKSPQTLRRMIKRGDLVAKRLKTPQGFQYMVDMSAYNLPQKNAEKPPIQVSPDSPIQNRVEAEELAENDVLTNQNEIPTSQDEIKPLVEAENVAIDKIGDFFDGELAKRHKEKMALIGIMELLQAELEAERRKPKSLFSYLIEWLCR